MLFFLLKHINKMPQRTKQTKRKATGNLTAVGRLQLTEACHKAAPREGACKKTSRMTFKRGPSFDTLGDLLRYTKLNQENVYRYVATAESRNSIRVSITQAKKSSRNDKVETSLHKVKLSNNTKFSFKCTTKEICALFSAMYNYNRLNPIVSDEYDMHRLNEDETGHLYPVYSWDNIQKDYQLDSRESLKNDGEDGDEHTGLLDTLIKDIKERIQDNTFSYNAQVAPHTSLSIRISPVSDKIISITMSRELLLLPGAKAQPPPQSENFQYELDLHEAAALMGSLGDMLFRVRSEKEDKTSIIVRQDIQGKGDIQYIKIRTKIPHSSFDKVGKKNGKYFDINPHDDDGSECEDVDEDEKSAAFQEVYGGSPQNNKQDDSKPFGGIKRAVDSQSGSASSVSGEEDVAQQHQKHTIQVSGDTSMADGSLADVGPAGRPQKEGDSLATVLHSLLSLKVVKSLRPALTLPPQAGTRQQLLPHLSKMLGQTLSS
jgi:hypothetical protein